jgi:predicted alternative tryptophan synthase beta-subunit
VARGKRKLLSRKKRTREEQDAEEALAVARAADRVEKGGRNSGILIGDSLTHILLSDRVLGTEATKVTEAQVEEPQV